MTTYEISARNKKASALLAVLQKAKVTADEARQSDANGWRLAAEAASVNIPSADTIAIVIKHLEAR